MGPEGGIEATITFILSFLSLLSFPCLEPISTLYSSLDNVITKAVFKGQDHILETFESPLPYIMSDMCPIRANGVHRLKCAKMFYHKYSLMGEMFYCIQTTCLSWYFHKELPLSGFGIGTCTKIPFLLNQCIC